MEKKVSSNFLAKEKIVEQIKEKIQSSKSIIIVDFKGLTVSQDTTLRNEFRKNGVEYKVLKNTLVRKALNELGYQQFDDLLKSTTSVAFCQSDEVTAAKIVTDMSKKFADKISAKAGIVNGSAVDTKEIATLASIPSREVLIAKVVGCLASSIVKFVYVVNAIKEAKEQA